MNSLTTTSRNLTNNSITIRSFSSSSKLLRKVFKNDNSDPMDIKSMDSEFNFPLTRPTILKQELRREFLHYLRLEENEFSQLVAFRKKFITPTKEEFIKVRHQHYQGENHPGSKKVVITIKIDSIPFKNDSIKHKFKLLAGPRWNSDLNEIKISCELFPTDKMNEKWCSDVLDKMLTQAEDQTDSMSDIPLDTRPTLSRLKKSGKKRLVTLKDFPIEWLPSISPVPAVVESSKST